MQFTRRQAVIILAGSAAGAVLLGRSALLADDGWFRIAPDHEPGEELIVSGIVYDRDRSTPLRRARLFIYHTDAEGRYSHRRGEPRYVARLRAFASADAEGRYEFHTIRPGGYPNSNTPQHIHVHVAPPGTPDSEITDYRYAVPSFWFADDPRLDESQIAGEMQRGRFSRVLAAKKESNGVWRGVRDLILGERDS